MQHEQLYFDQLAAAYVRGCLPSNPSQSELFSTQLSELSAEQRQALFNIGLAAGLRLHRFKRTMALPRVKRVLGILQGLQPAQLLDIGSGRGAFLWPLLDCFGHLTVTAIDQNAKRAQQIQALHLGGVERLSSRQMDVTNLILADNSYDVVTLLEVLEHIPDTLSAISEVMRVAERFVLLSVPSKADDNPEHIHLFTQQQLNDLLLAAGAVRVQFDYVPNHLIALAKLNFISPTGY